ncbi:MrcB family domain-containing protein [Natronoarchaeum sp. GCM10025321]|uniref:MrcB family domain-containing protein n=1 Tax=Natronoarchaeum sp. GCM10025321 TaxID=3252684 RepID=UPI0036159A36
MGKWRSRVRKELRRYQEQIEADQISLQELEKQVLPTVQSDFPDNDNPDAAFRRTLQELRDQGDVEFLGNGEYILDFDSDLNLKEAFSTVLRDYKEAKERGDQSHHAAELIKDEIPSELKQLLADDHLLFKGSVGAGTMANIPWIGIFDTRVTQSPQEGLYVVYLFDTDSETVFLTLNQGMTDLQDSFGTKIAREVLAARAEALRDVVDVERFENSRIHLPDKFLTSRNSLYGISTICHRAYDLEDMPSTDVLREDVRRLVDTYQDLIESNDYQTLLDAFDPDEQEQLNPFEGSTEGGNDGTSVQVPNPKEAPRRASEIAEQLESVGQVVLHGPPGTGKTYTARQFTKWWLHERNENPTTDQFREVTFHPSFTYEDFIEGLAAHTQGGDVVYEVESGIFKQICEDARREYQEALSEDRTPSPYVLLIDEINRGNLAKIFGEAITLLEKDKRGADPQNSSVSLAHSGEPFVIPPNLYLIGTMNTADRSIALVDAALRRRFSFHSFPPDYTVLLEEYDYNWGSMQAVQQEALQAESVTHRTLLAASIAALSIINKRILDTGDLGKGKRVGHSYLLGTKDINDIVNAWKYQILPLLEEYYFEDLDRLQSDLFGTPVPFLFDSDQYEITRFEAGELQETLTDLLAQSGIGSQGL